MTDSPVLLITGAGSGIGAATARHAIEAGWRVVLAARSHDTLAAFADELGGPAHSIAVRCDVTSWPDQQAAVAAALATFGRLDAFMANAGIGAKRGFLEDTVEHWKTMIDTNVYGAALSIRAALGHFRSQGSGHMVLMSSIAGRRIIPGSTYSPTKWAVTAMGEGLRQEVAGTGIRVTLIEPGPVDTPFFAAPLPHSIEADDVARAVMFALHQPPGVEVGEIMVQQTGRG